MSLSVGNVQNYNYGYDTYGRLNQINNINYGYLANSNLLGSVARPNGINTTWNYETNRNLVTSLNSSNLNIAYTNNAIGNRTSMTLNDEVINYNYNDRSEVTGATSSSNDNYNYAYNFDPIGNRLTSTNTTYTTNALNQYIQISSVVSGQFEIFEPTYDLDGNMLTRDGWTQTWNGENRLISMTKDSQRLEFAYDYMGRRVSKKVYENDTLTKHTLFVYNEYKLIEELDALNNNINIKSYTWQYSIGLDTPLTMTIANQTYYYQTDANKNVMALIDVNGETVANYKYSPFGEAVSATGELANINPFKFSSEYHDTETNLIYYNYRYYSPLIGRWLKRDPMTEYGGYNLYGMVNNNSILFWDFNGLWGLGEHMEMVLQAYNNSDCSELSFPDLLRLLRGSILPDIPYVGENLPGYLDGDFSWEDFENLVDDSIATYRSHWGDLGYLHGMGTGGNPNEFRGQIIDELSKRANDFRNNGDTLSLGSALHTLGDTFAPSHTARNPDGSINRYQDYNAQDSKKHKEGDKKNGPGGANRIQFDNAVKALTDFLNDVCDEDCPQKSIEDGLKNGPLKHGPTTIVGGSISTYAK